MLLRRFLKTTLPILLLLCNLNDVSGKTADKEDGGSARGGSEYLIGTGIYDMTGPAAQINFMGYASTSQNGHGIHLRLRSRAYIISKNDNDGPATESKDANVAMMEETSPSSSDLDTKSSLRGTSSSSTSSFEQREAKPKTSPIKYNPSPDSTICFVSIDAGMGSDLLTARVLARLSELLPNDSDSKALCHIENTSISGTHTHSGPGGYLQYTLYQVTSLGYSRETMDTFVESIAQSLLSAYHNLQPGTISTNQGLLFDANINRSPSSYLMNPTKEREEYKDEGDTDKNMVLLRLDGENGKEIGSLNWFAVHGTSMNNTNTLISGDNKGFASYLMEKHFNGKDVLPGQGDFVAAFASTNLGDVSPNTDGPKCIDTGLPCDTVTSSCNGKNELCIASGPGKDMFESTEIIGRKQYQHAAELYQKATSTLSGRIDYRHSFIDMSNINVKLEDGKTVKTCSAALGYSFAAGTTDGPGALDFTQNTNTSNPFWDLVGGFVSKPTPEQTACQAPKPILLNTGTAHEPYSWDPSRVPISIFRVGDFFILNVPCEFTTMAGRRLRKSIRAMAVAQLNIKNPIVVIAGLANSYTHYVTTFEEYQAQRYEAASTLYGPHTLMAYVQEFERLMEDMVGGEKSVSGNPPEDLEKEQLSLILPVEMDFCRFGKKFGQVITDAKGPYTVGKDTVSVSFHSANPRNDQKIQKTYLTVDKKEQNKNTWTTKYVDGDWSTRFLWEGNRLGISTSEIRWTVPQDAESGTYRICHYGTRKRVLNMVSWAVDSMPHLLNWNGVGVQSVVLQAVATVLDAAITHSYFMRKALLGENVMNGLEARLDAFEGCSREFVVA